MNCEQVPLIELLRAELGASETEEALSHIETCTTCRERLQTMAAVEASYRERTWEPNTPRLWLLAAAVLLAALASIFYQIWLHSNVKSVDLASLATQEKYPYFPLQTRSEDERSQLNARERAFAAYNAGEFGQANEWFAKLPLSAEIFFYSGVSHYFLEEYSQALDKLAKASELENHWRMAALWYQANVYLKINQKRLAEETLKGLVGEGQNAYHPRALKLLEQLENAE